MPLQLGAWFYLERVVSPYTVEIRIAHRAHLRPVKIPLPWAKGRKGFWSLICAKAKQFPREYGPQVHIGQEAEGHHRNWAPFGPRSPRSLGTKGQPRVVLHNGLRLACGGHAYTV